MRFVHDGSLRNRKPEYLVIGRVVAPWGTKGELKVEILTDFPHRFSLLKTVHLDGEPRALEGCRQQGRWVILKLEGCSDRDEAARWRGKLVQVPLEEAMPLEKDEYYIYQILGLEVWTTSGELLGRVSEVLSTGSNDVYLVQGEGGGGHPPCTAGAGKEGDLASGRLLVEPMEGMV